MQSPFQKDSRSRQHPVTSGAVMNWQAPFYDLGCRLVGLGARFRTQTLAHAALKRGERVLDVGCGTGVLTRLAAQAVAIGAGPPPGNLSHWALPDVFRRAPASFS